MTTLREAAEELCAAVTEVLNGKDFVNWYVLQLRDNLRAALVAEQANTPKNSEIPLCSCIECVKDTEPEPPIRILDSKTPSLAQLRIYILERQVDLLNEIGNRVSSPTDRYAGLMYYDDAEALKDWLKELKVT